MTCWRTTFSAIRLSLLHKGNGDSDARHPSPTNGSPVRPLERAMARMEDLRAGCGHLAVRIEGCHPLAAPFILFRLKRMGLSGCRVTHENGGLTIVARR